MDLATFTDLQNHYPEPIDDDQQTYAETLLDNAADEILDKVPSLDARLANAPDLRLWKRVVRIQCAMVGRVLSNPHGYLTESIDDYTYRRDSATSTGRLYLDDSELADLQPTNRRRGNAFSIRLG